MVSGTNNCDNGDSNGISKATNGEGTSTSHLNKSIQKVTSEEPLDDDSNFSPGCGNRNISKGSIGNDCGNSGEDTAVTFDEPSADNINNDITNKINSEKSCDDIEREETGAIETESSNGSQANIATNTAEEPVPIVPLVGQNISETGNDSIYEYSNKETDIDKAKDCNKNGNAEIEENNKNKDGNCVKTETNISNNAADSAVGVERNGNNNTNVSRTESTERRNGTVGCGDGSGAGNAAAIAAIARLTENSSNNSNISTLGGSSQDESEQTGGAGTGISGLGFLGGTSGRGNFSGMENTTGTTTTMVITQQESTNTGTNDLPILRLTLRPRSHVTWDEGVVNNEGLGRKSSKRCCIFHKQRAFGESSTESSEDDSSSDANGSDGSGSSSSSGGGGSGRAQRPIARKKKGEKKMGRAGNKPKIPDYQRFHA